MTASRTIICDLTRKNGADLRKPEVDLLAIFLFKPQSAVLNSENFKNGRRNSFWFPQKSYSKENLVKWQQLFIKFMLMRAQLSQILKIQKIRQITAGTFLFLFIAGDGNGSRNSFWFPQNPYSKKSRQMTAIIH